MTTENRIILQSLYGPEVVVQCCTMWKTHYGDGRFGKCGRCNKQPILTNLKWDELNKELDND